MFGTFKLCKTSHLQCTGICFCIQAHAIDTPAHDNGNVRSASVPDQPPGDDVLDTRSVNDSSVLVELDMKLTPEQWMAIAERYQKQFIM